MIKDEENKVIRALSVEKCSCCGEKGTLIYQQLTDQLYGASGSWNFRKCNDSNCHLLWLDPSPITEDLWKAYVSYHTHLDTKIVSKQNMWNLIRDAYLQEKMGYKNRLKHQWLRPIAFLAYLHPFGIAHIKSYAMFLGATHGQSGKLLDVGCGNGEALERMKSLGWEVEGVDFDPEAVENAREKGIKVNLGDVNAQKYPANHFDAIYMSHVIEHVSNYAKLLNECNRILKPGGKLILLTPNSDSLGHKFFRQTWRGLEHPRHLQIFNSINIQKVVDQAKFSNINITTSAKSAYYILWMSRLQRNYFYANILPKHINMNILEKVTFLMLQIVERFFMIFNPKLGEEILLIACKR
jgi:2-polyprenyl-3-methyl-5-hydroxy-6-metoxy-1,4-benzoquinol methylase